ncbi:MAG TPA: transcriptional regulator NrdR [Eubacteriales bacterium]|jgi:transcriptional repressor NrdR|nr:transcriptional regulator NrdR [Eubacteriales bacterium]
MRCVFCGCEDSKVIDSRPTDDGKSIRRRRECIGCGKRFTTFETIETTPLIVVKSSGVRQQFDKNKVKNGIIKACEKRPVSMSEIDKLVDSVEKQLYNSLDQEISSKKIGELVMNGLKDIDEVAYIRFASVYRQFKDSATFFEEMSKLFEKKK